MQISVQAMNFLRVALFEFQITASLNLKPVNDHGLVHALDASPTTPRSGQQFQSLLTPWLGSEPEPDAHKHVGDVEKQIIFISKQPNRRNRQATTFGCDICEHSFRIRHLYKAPKNGQGELKNKISA